MKVKRGRQRGVKKQCRMKKRIKIVFFFKIKIKLNQKIYNIDKEYQSETQGIKKKFKKKEKNKKLKKGDNIVS